LFKSLCSFCKPFGLILGIEKHSFEFTVLINVKNEEHVIHYFTRILTILEEERQFKTLLKKVIENQHRFQAEEALLMNELFH